MERSEAESIVADSPALAVDLLLRLDVVRAQYAEVVEQNAVLVAQSAALAERVAELERRAKRSSRTSHQPEGCLYPDSVLQRGSRRGGRMPGWLSGSSTSRLW